jgi:hypothetical protein
LPLSPALVDTLVLFLLVAASIRTVMAFVGAAIGWTHLPFVTHGQQLGNALIWAGDFADGQGVLLLIAVFLLIWVRLSGTGPRPGSDAASDLGRPRAALVWLSVLFVLAVVGSAGYIAGNTLYFAGTGPKRIVWQHIVGTGGFYFAYLVVALGGIMATTRLLGSLSGSRALVDRRLMTATTDV